MIPVSELLKDHRLHLSKFQMSCHSVAMNGYTTYGMYEQALRELLGRHGPLRALRLEHEVLETRIDDMRNVDGDVEVDYAQLQALEWALEEKARAIEAVEYEYNHFHAVASMLKERLGDLDDKKRESLDREKWYQQTLTTMAIELIAHGALSGTTVASIASMPRTMRNSLLDELSRPDDLKMRLETRPGLLEEATDEIVFAISDGVGASGANARPVVVTQ